MSNGNAILLNDYCYVNGGASRVAIDEAVGLAEAGVRVIFLGAVGPVCAELQRPHIEVFCLDQPELLQAAQHPGVMLQGLWNTAAYRTMDGLLQMRDAADTIVHLHGYTKALSTSPVRAAVKRGFRVICTLHDFFAACPNGAFYDYIEQRPCPRRGLSFDCISSNCDKRHYAHKLYRVARGAMQKTAGMLPSGVHDYITLSRRSETILMPYLPERSRLHPLENLVEVPKAMPVNVGDNDTVVAVGRLDVEKGIEVLLQAAQQAGITLRFVGDGPLRAQVEAQGHSVTGWLSPEQVQAELEQARVLAFPSLWYETYGLVVAEAAARGVPAIVSDICAAAERVEDGVSGWIVRAGDVADLARCLTQAVNSADIRAIGRAAYDQFWANPPTRQRHIDGLLTIYDTVLAA